MEEGRGGARTMRGGGGKLTRRQRRTGPERLIEVRNIRTSVLEVRGGEEGEEDAEEEGLSRGSARSALRGALQVAPQGGQELHGGRGEDEGERGLGRRGVRGARWEGERMKARGREREKAKHPLGRFFCRQVQLAL